MNSNTAISTKHPSKNNIDFTPGKMINFKTYLQPDPTYYFGNQILDHLGDLLIEQGLDRVYFITNDVLFDLYAKDFTDMFERKNIPYEALTIKDREHDKSFSNLENLCDTLVNKFITKGSVVIGFGGGCLTNIVGLAAGLIFRGIRYVEIPTTF
ncbi:MAG: hypothetical protein ACRDBM_04360, partial [Sporomusa sp.]